jgi:hypothetical protein
MKGKNGRQYFHHPKENTKLREVYLIFDLNHNEIIIKNTGLLTSSLSNVLAIHMCVSYKINVSQTVDGFVNE